MGDPEIVRLIEVPYDDEEPNFSALLVEMVENRRQRRRRRKDNMAF